jgi:hypothetical protein
MKMTKGEKDGHGLIMKLVRKAASMEVLSLTTADHVLGTFKTQHDAADWAKSQGHAPLIARVRELNDKKKPDHWGSA